jgi:acetolactate synthase-1/2/3 large subunit
MKTSDFIANFLVEHGITHCYGFQGTMIAHLVDSLCRNEKLQNHVCYNEQGAAFAAVGEAKASGRVTFAYSTSGPGAANLISGIADAYYDSVPVIFVTGQLNTYEYLSVPGIKQHGFQEMDVVDTVRPLVKYCEKVEHENDLKRIFEEAYYRATEGRPGPVLIDLPMDMQRQEIDPDSVPGFVPPEVKEVKADCGSIAGDIVKALSEAERPVIALGNGICKSSRDQVRTMIRKLGVPVVTSMLGRDIMSCDDPLNFGFIGAAYGHRYANIITHKKADLIISLGCSLCKRQTGMKTENFARNARIIRVDIDPLELERKIHSTEESYLADCNDVVAALCATEAHELASEKWLAICSDIREKMKEFDDSCDEREPNKVVGLISNYTGAAGAICCDVGQHQVWGAQSYDVREGQRLLFSGGHGAMGFALPASIGAYYACNKPVITIAGDGAFQMNIQELQWVYRENLPVTMFVMNNRSLGLIQQQQDDIFDGRYYSSVAEGGYLTPDFCEIGKAYKISSYRAEGREELEKVLQQLDLSRPNLVEVILDVKSRAYPKTFFGEEMHNQKPYMPKELLDSLLAE